MGLSTRTISKKRFFQFLIILFIGWAIGALVFRRFMELTPETFHAFISSLGFFGPAIYIGIFMIRPFFLISSIALFIAGGLALGPVWGPLFAVAGCLRGADIAPGWLATGSRLVFDYDNGVKTVVP